MKISSASEPHINYARRSARSFIA